MLDKHNDISDNIEKTTKKSDTSNLSNYNNSIHQLTKNNKIDDLKAQLTNLENTYKFKKQKLLKVKAISIQDFSYFNKNILNEFTNELKNTCIQKPVGVNENKLHKIKINELETQLKLLLKDEQYLKAHDLNLKIQEMKNIKESKELENYKKDKLIATNLEYSKIKKSQEIFQNYQKEHLNDLVKTLEAKEDQLKVLYENKKIPLTLKLNNLLYN